MTQISSKFFSNSIIKNFGEFLVLGSFIILGAYFLNLGFWIQLKGLRVTSAKFTKISSLVKDTIITAIV